MGFSQNDIRWAWKKIGVYGDRMGNWPGSKGRPIGCMTTAISRVLNRYGFRSHPGMFCDWLNKNGGYMPDGRLKHEALARYTNGQYSWHETDARDQDSRIIIAVKWGAITHWVSRHSGSGATEMIEDSWDGKVKLLNQKKWVATGRRVRLV